jgi:hypothetical protein
MFMTFGVVLIGLALVSVCINVVREKLEQLYMALLQKMLEDYMKAAASGDESGAAKDMMAGFQGKAKFLMPLIRLANIVVARAVTGMGIHILSICAKNREILQL